jgi:hypothetical protein
MSIPPRIVLDFFHGPTDGFMKPYGTFVAHRRDGLHAFCARFSTIGFERRVQKSRDTSTSKVGMNADEMHVAHGAIRCDKPEQKAHHVPFAFDDPRQLSELVEINRMRQGTRRTAPPSVDDAHDLVEIGLFEGSTGQVIHGASGLYPTRALVSVSASRDDTKDLSFREQLEENMLAVRP